MVSLYSITVTSLRLISDWRKLKWWTLNTGAQLREMSNEALNVIMSSLCWGRYIYRDGIKHMSPRLALPPGEVSLMLPGPWRGGPKKKKKKDRQQRKRKNIGDTCRLLTCSLSEQKHGNLKEAERNNSFGIKGALIKYVYSSQLLRGAEASGSNTFQIDSRSEKAEGGRKAQQVMGSWFILTRKSSVSRRFSLKLKGRSSVQTAKLFSCTF